MDQREDGDQMSGDLHVLGVRDKWYEIVWIGRRERCR